MGKSPWKSLFLQRVAISYDSTFVIACTAFVNFFEVTPQVTRPYLKMTPRSKSIFWKWTPANEIPPLHPSQVIKDQSLRGKPKGPKRFSAWAKSVVSYFLLLFIVYCFVCHKLYKAKKSNYLNSHGEKKTLSSLLVAFPTKSVARFTHGRLSRSLY